jgi:hypothetical protein
MAGEILGGTAIISIFSRKRSGRQLSGGLLFQIFRSERKNVETISKLQYETGPGAIGSGADRRKIDATRNDRLIVANILYCNPDYAI